MMEPSLYRFILKYSWRDQVYLLILTVISLPLLYGALDLPKVIINDAIGGQNFPKDVYGFGFDQVQYLMLLCFAFLGLTFLRFGFRYYVNVYKGQLAERMLRRMRYQLFSRVLLFPLAHFRSVSQGELIAMMTSEVEPVGGFTGDSIALPAFEGGTLLTILAFMFVQDWKMGLAAISLFPVQMYLIPKLQRQVNALAKERVRTVRKLSERIGETVAGVEDIHANDTAELERAHFSYWTGIIYRIRFKIYRKKFFIKFLNNFFGQLTPFFFFSIGGYLVIQGDLTFGALVAVLAAFKDLSSPWKELLSWYEQKEDARVKYDQLLEQFRPGSMLDEALLEPPPGPPPRLAGPVVASNLTLAEEGGIRVVDAVNFSFDIGERVALAGREGSGQSALAKLLARLVMPTAGSLRIGELDLARAPEAVTGRRIAYIGHGGTLFQGSIRDNLLYGLQHQALAEARYEADSDALEERRRVIREAMESGNTASDLAAQWIDYEAAGVDGPAGLDDRLVTVLRKVELEGDVLGLGLQGLIDPQRRPDLADGILEARAVLSRRLAEPEYAGLVERFDPDRYNRNMTIAENVLFGTPIGREFDLEHLANNPYMVAVLERVGLTEDFLTSGLEVARVMLELFGDAEPGDEMFERFSFIAADALPTFQAVVRRADVGGLAALAEDDRTLLMSLPFKLIAARHRLGLVGERAEERLLEARQQFAAGLPADLKGAVAFFEPERYNPAASVQDNILFGRLVYGRQQSKRLIGGLIDEVIDGIGLRPAIIGLGLEHPVGLGGSRLSAVQRQKVVIARGLLKRADLIVVDRATAPLDPATQAAILANVLGDAGPSSVVWVLGEADDEGGFDHLYVMEHGRIVVYHDRRADREPPPRQREAQAGS